MVARTPGYLALRLIEFGEFDPGLFRRGVDLGGALVLAFSSFEVARLAERRSQHEGGQATIGGTFKRSPCQSESPRSRSPFSRASPPSAVSSFASFSSGSDG